MSGVPSKRTILIHPKRDKGDMVSASELTNRLNTLSIQKNLSSNTQKSKKSNKEKKPIQAPADMWHMDRNLISVDIDELIDEDEKEETKLGEDMFSGERFNMLEMTDQIPDSSTQVILLR